ncbi:MAG TPA: threonine-phosphate decarboxylase CobD [Terriglobia bacterium]|nr:threonine-phosphate decarboxylase CobD [Terriglobia bacterium]
MHLRAHGGNIFGAARRLHAPVSAIMDFSASINPLGLSRRARRRLEAELDLVRYYPDTSQHGLRTLVASREDINPDTILFGNGATQLLHLIPRYFRPRSVLLAQPSFSEYEAALLGLRCRVRHHLLKPSAGFRVVPDKLLKALRDDRPDLLILANPNNPTGVVIPAEILFKIVRLCHKQGTWFLADESFIDFTSQPSLVRQVSRQQNLVVLRSFTKFFALPGLRIGYLVASSPVIKELSNRIEPWSVNTLAVIAAAESMKDAVFRNRSLALIARERQYVSQGLENLGWLDAYPSEANFLLVRIKSKAINACGLYRRLEAMRILIRKCTDFRGLSEEYIRVAVRTRKENRSLLHALRRVGEELGPVSKKQPCPRAKS